MEAAITTAFIMTLTTLERDTESTRSTTRRTRSDMVAVTAMEVDVATAAATFMVAAAVFVPATLAKLQVSFHKNKCLPSTFTVNYYRAL